MINTEVAAWRDRADLLGGWAWERLVNRDDCWGNYWLQKTAGGWVTRTCTRPAVYNRGLVRLTSQVLANHFRAASTSAIVGLHTTSSMNTSKWGTIEIDYHSADSSPPEINRRSALRGFELLTAEGFHPLLWDSNGKGGYHVDLLLAAPVPTSWLYTFLKNFLVRHANLGLPYEPESFPKQAALKPGRYGNWVRVIGRHHTHLHWAKVWDGAAWLEGGAAIDHILSHIGDDPALIPQPSEEMTNTTPKHGTTMSKDGTVLRMSKSGSASINARVAAYLRQLPNLGEGQGRDDIAYGFAAWLVRDLNLSDVVALIWLNSWDQANSPPKGEERLRQILHNVHQYGRNVIGCGLRNSDRREV
jgi:hypothetical protein